MDDTLRSAPSEGQVTDPRAMREVLVTAAAVIPRRGFPLLRYRKWSTVPGARTGSDADGRAAGRACRAMRGDGCPRQLAPAAGRGPVPERPHVRARSDGRPWRGPRSGPASRSAGADSMVKETAGGGDDGDRAMARRISCSWTLSCSSLLLPFMTDQPNAAEKTPAQRGRVRAGGNQPVVRFADAGCREGWIDLSGRSTRAAAGGCAGS